MGQAVSELRHIKLRKQRIYLSYIRNRNNIFVMYLLIFSLICIEHSKTNINNIVSLFFWENGIFI